MNIKRQLFMVYFISFYGVYMRNLPDLRCSTRGITLLENGVYTYKYGATLTCY